MAEKRIIEQNASTELYSDDWFIKDSALQGTTKISQSKLKELFLDGTLTLEDLSSASAWTTNTYYDRDSVVYHDGKLYRNLSGKRLHEATFSTDDWTEIDTDFVKMINDLEDSMAIAWADTQNYYEGDYAFYNGHYYRCISNATTGTWEPNKWYKTTLSSEIRQYLWKFAHYMSISTESSLTPYSKGQLAIRSIDHVDHLLMAKEDYPQGVTSFDPDQWIDLSVDDEEWISGLSKTLVGMIDDVSSDIPTDASGLSYDNTDSGLEADDVQDALDEVVGLIAEAGQVDDVKVDGTSVVTNKVAEIEIPVKDVEVDGTSVVNEQGVAEVEIPVQDVQVKTDSTYDSVVDASGNAKIDLSSVTAYGEVPNLPQSVATFNDGSDNPLKSLKVGIEPQQDLHGYDAPWVGGAGKNLFNKPNLVMNKAIPQGTVIYGQIFGVTASFKLYGYDENDNEYEVMPLSVNKNSTTTTRAYVRLEISQSALNALGNGNLMVSLSDFTRFEPYENICPISGWDEVNVTRCGKNVWGYGIGSPDVTGTYWGWYIPYNTKATIKLFDKGNSGDITNLYFGFTGNGNNADGGVDWMIRAGVVEKTTLETTTQHFISIYQGNQEALDKLFNRFNIMVTVDGQPNSIYEPYNGQTYTIDLDGTRYGGTLDVVSGVLTVDRAYVDMGSPTWSYTNNRFYYNPTNAKVYTQIEVANLLCSQYPKSQYNSQADNSISSYAGYIYVRADSYSGDTTAFKQAMSGVQLVYELATPLTIQLTPTEVKSLLGANNIWADTGDINDCIYQRDLNTTINDIIARIEALEA